MEIKEIRDNFIVQSIAALLVGIGLDHLFGIVRGITAQYFLGLGNWLIDQNNPFDIWPIIIINSSHAFVSGVIASCIGVLLLVLAFQIRNMLLPFITCVSFTITTYWWLFSDLQQVMSSSTSDHLLIQFTGHTVAILSWLLMSWVWVRYAMPNKLWFY